MELKFRATFANEDLHYAVGVLDPAEDYAIRVVDPTHIIMTDREKWTPGTDPSAVFGITEEEYNWKDTDPDKLDDLAQKLRSEIPKDRLIAEKDGVREKDRAESIDYGKYVRYRKAVNEQRRDAVIAKMLAAENLHVMYLNETGKPAVFGYNFILMYESKEIALDAANEYRKRNLPVLVSTFTKEQYNKEETKSVFQELIVMGFPTILFTDADKRQSMILIKDIIKHKDFIGQKNNLIYGNPALDFALTNMFQFMRTPNPIDRSDPEKAKEMVTKQIAFYESRIVESLSDARFLVPTMALPDGKITTPVLRMQPKAQQPEAAADTAENADKEEKKETKAAKKDAKEENAEETPAKQYLPVFTNGMEFYSDKDSYKAAVLTYDNVMDLVKDAKLDGIVINMKSRCALPCGPERFKQVEDYRAWKAEQDAKNPAPAENAEEAPADDTAAEQTDEGGDKPFVPIINKNK